MCIAVGSHVSSVFSLWSDYYNQSFANVHRSPNKKLDKDFTPAEYLKVLYNKYIIFMCSVFRFTHSPP